MEAERLVRMANDIARFYQAEPDRDEAIAGVEGHLRRFWEPRMRRQIEAHLAAGGEGMDELTRLAVGRLGVAG